MHQLLGTLGRFEQRFEFGLKELEVAHGGQAKHSPRPGADMGHSTSANLLRRSTVTTSPCAASVSRYSAIVFGGFRKD